MPQSPSNRALLIDELRQLVIRYREKPSTLLAELESFLDEQGIGLGQHRREIEKRKDKEPDLLRKTFEDISKFLGDAL